MPADAKAFLHDRWKYIHHFELSLIDPQLSLRYRSGTELYDVEKDPKETENVVSEHRDVASELHTKMLAVLPEVERRRLSAQKSIGLDETSREKLKSLGYFH